MQDYYRTIAHILNKAQGETTQQGKVIDISTEATELMVGIADFRVALIQAMDALDTAQAMLEYSQHHPKILAAYRLVRTTVGGEP
jgi:pterin-4a-carbinolamine dehydratase